MGYLRDNERKISDSLGRVIQRKNAVISDTMREVVGFAMEDALMSHDEDHARHTAIGDTYGWAVVHDKEVVAFEVEALYAPGIENTRKELELAASNCPDGWAGIVLARMNDGTTNYYSIRYEEEILRDVSDDAAQSLLNKLRNQRFV